jgi:hypothetical protein
MGRGSEHAKGTIHLLTTQPHPTFLAREYVLFL